MQRQRMVMASASLTVVLLLSLLPLASLAQAQGNITAGSGPLTADDRNSSWKSPSGDFAFGFQEVLPGGYLLAIWFDKIPEKTILWWANADLAPKGSKVVVTKQGLILSDPYGKQIWYPTISAGISHASLLNTGNFVLVDGNGSILWESFSQPTDTIVPSQVLDQEQKLISRYSATNYSNGRFQLYLHSDGNVNMNTYPTADTAYWYTTEGNGNQLVFNQTGEIYLIAENGSLIKTIMSGEVSISDFYQRAVLDYDGVFRKYAYPKSSGPSRAMFWSVVSSPIPADICTSMRQSVGAGVCGWNSICVLGSDQRPGCICPDGYSFIDPSNQMNGCKPDFLPQRCDKGETDSFTMRGRINTDWPLSDYEHYTDKDEKLCSQACLNDCLCDVTIFRDGNCWKKRMPLSNGKVDPSVGGKAFIKVRTDNSTWDGLPGVSNKKSDRVLLIVGAVTLGSSTFILFVLTLLFCFQYNKVKKAKILQQYRVDRFSSTQSFTYKELEEATSGFKEEIGRGAFGAVYKGNLTSISRRAAAVKVLQKITSEGDREFKNEMSTIGRTNHRNLVELIGYCDEGQHRLLVYDFMPNGSLADFLFGCSRPNWFKRIEIACGVARGLSYLHEECSKQIIHCDIKPQNILLDEYFTAKISDFGLAKLLMTGQTRTMTDVRGTKGYLAPEWFRSMPISSKVDVYSFGIVLLELICCRKNCEFEAKDESQMILAEWVYDCYYKDELDLIIKDDAEMYADKRRALRFVMIAMWCIQEDPSLRPSMKKLVQMLEGSVEVSIPPGPSSFMSSIQ